MPHNVTLQELKIRYIRVCVCVEGGSPSIKKKEQEKKGARKRGKGSLSVLYHRRLPSHESIFSSSLASRSFGGIGMWNVAAKPVTPGPRSGCGRGRRRGTDAGLRAFAQWWNIWRKSSVLLGRNTIRQEPSHRNHLIWERDQQGRKDHVTGGIGFWK